MDLSIELAKPLFILAATLTGIWIISKWLHYRKLPPGPYGFPVIGYLPYLTKDRPHKIFKELGKKYGNIISVNAGNSTLVIINDCETAKKILSKPVTMARPNEFVQIFPGKAGFGTSNGPQWLEQRRFCMNVMKDLGMGRGEWERMIHDETVEFLEEIRGWKGKAIDFLNSLEFSQIGNTLSLLIGRRLSKDKNCPETKLLLDFTNTIMPLASASSFMVHLPFSVLKLLKWLQVGSVKKAFKCSKDFENFLRKEIEKNKKMPSGAKEAPNFINYYLEELEKQEKSGKEHYFSVENLVGNMSSLYLGGVDTTKASLHWLLLIIASRPDVQKKIHDEIDNFSGKEHQIYWDERKKFPYIMATINEMERWVAVTPLYPPRRALEDFEMEGYVIPKKAVILVNNWEIMRDQRYHKNAEDFDPERFLDKGTNQVKKVDSFFPFSMGKRNCPGEQVAMMTIFLYFTAIMQKFRVVCPKGKTVVFEDKGIGATRQAVAQELHFIER